MILCYKEHDKSFIWYYYAYDISKAILDLDPDLYQNFLFSVTLSILLIQMCMMPLMKAELKGVISFSKMPTVRNARSLVTSRELPSGLQIWGRRPLNALFSVATMNADTDSASEESVKVIQERVAHGTLYVRLTCPTMDNRHNKPSQVPEF